MRVPQRQNISNLFLDTKVSSPSLTLVLIQKAENYVNLSVTQKFQLLTTMKKLTTYVTLSILMVCCGLISIAWFGPESASTDVSDLNGAWRIKEVNEEWRKTWPNATAVKTLSNGLFAFAYFEVDTKKFIGTGGGTYTFENGVYTETIEFMSLDSSYVGKSLSFKSKLIKGNKEWKISGELEGEPLKERWVRIDDASSSDLAGAWRIRERANREGKMTPMRRGPRKTIKYLSDTRFQWVAFNVATKQFMGTGGGTYTMEDGKYTEHIDFFSRDSSRVGMSLSFNYVVKDGDWHHSGKSSRGNPINEIWAIESN